MNFRTQIDSIETEETWFDLNQNCQSCIKNPIKIAVNDNEM